MSKRKPYRGPKYVAKNPMVTFMGGMSGVHASHLQATRLVNHAALAAITQGRGDKEQWDRLVGAVNIAIVMCEQGIGNEFREQFVAAFNALLACGKRSVKTDRFLFTGDELRAMNEAMDCHDAQLTNIRAIDVDRAAAEVIRRLNHRINSTSVMKELELEAA